MVEIEVLDDGKVELTDKLGHPLSGRDLSLAWKQHQQVLLSALQSRADEINGDLELLRCIHLDAPPPSPEWLVIPDPLEDSVPTKPVKPRKPGKPELGRPNPPGLVARLFGGQRRYNRRVAIIEAEERSAQMEWNAVCRSIDDQYQQDLKVWRGAVSRHQDLLATHLENARKTDQEFRDALAVDLDYSSSVLEHVLDQLTWPRETLVSFDLRLADREVWLDVDFPEIEDLPAMTATIAASGKRLNIKAKNQKALREDYARHVHAIALRLALTASACLPWSEVIVLSGFSQRLDQARGKVNEDYLLSVKFTRKGLEQIEHENLKLVHPVDAIAEFEHRRKMTSTGIFKPILPFS